MTLALLIMAVGGAWAQSANPEVIELKPDESGKNWILADMPASNIELQVEYFTESNLFLSKDALADKANIAVTAGELGVQFGEDGKSANTVTEGTAMTVKYNGTKKILGMKVAKKVATITITGAGRSTTLKIDGCATWADVVALNPEVLSISPSQAIQTNERELNKGNNTVHSYDTLDPKATDYKWVAD